MWCQHPMCLQWALNPQGEVKSACHATGHGDASISTARSPLIDGMHRHHGPHTEVAITHACSNLRLKCSNPTFKCSNPTFRCSNPTFRCSNPIFKFNNTHLIEGTRRRFLVPHGERAGGLGVLQPPDVCVVSQDGAHDLQFLRMVHGRPIELGVDVLG